MSNLLELLLLLLVAGVCGAVVQAMAGFSWGGFLVSVATGFIGALVGTWLARLSGLPEVLPIRIGTTTFPTVWSIIGGALFAAVVSLLSGPRIID